MHLEQHDAATSMWEPYSSEQRVVYACKQVFMYVCMYIYIIRICMCIYIPCINLRDDVTKNQGPYTSDGSLLVSVGSGEGIGLWYFGCCTV